MRRGWSREPSSASRRTRQGVWGCSDRRSAPYGCPVAVYHDRHGIFGTQQVPDLTYPTLPLTKSEPTQVERALEELSIRSIAARSPQAKGRVERLFGTRQDRLVSELRLDGVTTMEEANTFLATFLPRFNTRFCVPAADPDSTHQACPDGLDLDHVLAFRSLRTVGADNTVRLGKHCIHLLPSRDRMHFARGQVEIAEHLDGHLTVHYQGGLIASTEAPEEAPLLRARGRPRPLSRTPQGSSDGRGCMSKRESPPSE